MNSGRCARPVKSKRFATLATGACRKIMQGQHKREDQYVIAAQSDVIEF
jgi:hypothetical protein